MLGKVEQTLLQETIVNFGLDISPDVFQFTFDRSGAEHYLHAHPNVPFILRLSRLDGYFALDIPNLERSTIRHILVSPPKPGENEFKLMYYEDNVFTEFGSLREYFETLWDPEQKSMRTSIEFAPFKEQEAWEQFKLQQQQNQEHKIAVLSIQSLDKKKIALTPEELLKYEHQNSELKLAGDGHTGFAIAKVLNAPFVVVRSKENRDESTDKLIGHVGHAGLIVVTGHGEPGGDGIKGNYINIGDVEEIELFQKQIERGPVDIVSTAMDTGLKSGNHVTILLSICFGAVDSIKGAEDSFARKLAREFATHGISSTIIASEKPVLRFGTNAIIDEQIVFNNRLGMAAEHVCVFTTRVEGENANPPISVYKPYESIQLTKNGVVFLNPKKPQAALTGNQKTEEEEQCLQKQAEEEQRLQKQAEEEQRLQKQAEEEQRLQKQAEEEQRLQKQNEKNATPKVLTLGEQRFDLLLKNLLIKGEELKRRRELVNPVQNKSGHQNLDDAYEAVLKLEKKLRTAGDKYFANPSENNYFTFKNQCDRKIKSARKILDKHRGWSEFLINLAIGICTLGLGLLVKAGINLAMNKPCLFVHNTVSAQKLNEIEHFVQTIQSTA
ncbi:hypothetical protein [uncultured Legionella sp.]|uniref:hypothetical protein n=1 Tax=uncultured Legionella sp. TaxID=210934 RepID=UPI0026199B91|nr:hypothetical protein [uncultured Legionella sp.]